MLLSCDLLLREIYLIFLDDVQYPFSRFIKKGFKHVYALERQALGWVCLDPSRSDLTAIVLPATYHTNIIPEFQRQNPTATVLPIKMKPHNKSKYPRPMVLGCTSAIQYMLGVYWPCVLTPYQLYNKIIKSPPEHIEVFNPCLAEKAQSAEQWKQP